MLAMTTLIAFIVTFIAYQQFRLAQERFKLDLFEKRLAVFKATEEFIFRFPIQGASTAIFQQFNRGTKTASFLFDQDIVDFLKDAQKKAGEFVLCQERLNDKFHRPDEKELKEIAKKQTEIVAAFNEIHNELKDKFSSYLRFSKWKYGFIWGISN